MKQLPVELLGDTQQQLIDMKNRFDAKIENSKEYKELKKEIEMKEQEKAMTNEEAELRNVAGKVIAPTVDFLEVLLKEGSLTMVERFNILRDTVPHKKTKVGSDSDIDSKPQMKSVDNGCAINTSQSPHKEEEPQLTKEDAYNFKVRLNKIKQSLDRVRAEEGVPNIDLLEILYDDANVIQNEIHKYNWKSREQFPFVVEYSHRIKNIVSDYISMYIQTPR